MFRKIFVYPLLLVALGALVACNSAPPATPDTAATNRPTPTTAATNEVLIPAATNGNPADGYPAPAEQPSQTVAESYPAPAEIAADAPPASYPAPADGPTTAAPRTFTVIPEDSEVAYVVAETFLDGAVSQLGVTAGLADTIGRTQVIEGELVLDLSQANPLVSGIIQVDLSTLTSDQRMRDNRIKTDWLESATYPLATFTATSVENFPAGYTEGTPATFQLLGDLTIRGITQPATFDVTATLENGTITGTAVAPLTMTSFGVEPPNMLGMFTVADEFRIEITLTAREQ